MEVSPIPDLLQILTPEGKISDGLDRPSIPDDELLTLYRLSLLSRLFNERGMRLQRQGRIGFFAPSTGQEVAQVASAYALEKEDWIFPSYREHAVALARGASAFDLLNHFMGNARDPNLGRQNPAHFGRRDLNIVTPFSPIGAQIPQACGAAWGMKMEGSKKLAITYFGDGATSSNGFHAGMTFAGVFRLPIILFCQNNQWAISVPIHRQTAAETLADKGAGYGVPARRIDGNDVLAVWDTVREAARRAREGQGPTLIEALTYRLGAHSTADSPKRYRTEEEVERWERQDPLVRFGAYLQEQGLMSQEDQKALRQELDAQVREDVQRAEEVKRPEPKTVVTGVYAEPPWHLREQNEVFLRYHGRKGAPDG